MATSLVQRSTLPILLLFLLVITIVSNLRAVPSVASSSTNDAHAAAPPAIKIPSIVQAAAAAATAETSNTTIPSLVSIATASIAVDEEVSATIATGVSIGTGEIIPIPANAADESLETTSKASPPPPQKISSAVGDFSNTNQSFVPDYIHSKAWLEGKRLSNIDMEDLDFILSQILQPDDLLLRHLNTTNLLKRTVCHADSLVRNPSMAMNNSWNSTDQSQIKEWTFLLIYLSIHVWHHEPAKEEALVKLAQQKRKDVNSTAPSIKNYDFECRSAKFMITTIPSLGLGASLRMSAIYSILTAIAIGRVPIFLSNVQSSTVHESLSYPFLLGFPPRYDMQSAFLPTTPCVVTMENIERDLVSMVKGSVDDRKIRRKGKTRNQTITSARYLYVPGRMSPEKDGGIWAKARSNIHAMAKRLVDQVREQYASGKDGMDINAAERFRVWDMALERIRDNKFSFDQVPSESSIGFAPFRSASLMYLVRLNHEQQRQVQQGVQDTLPADFDPSAAVGMPIRASDKCRRESTCLTFERHMQLANETFEQYGYHKYKSGTGAAGLHHGRHSVVVTTEDSQVANASRHYPVRDFPIIINKADAQQDTGRPSNFKYKRQAENIMRSSLIALTLQMYPTHTYGNCCSNFHQVLFDLLASSCGLNKKRMCLMDHPNPQFKVCCLWSDGACGSTEPANATITAEIA